MSPVAPNIRSIVDHDGAVILDIRRDSMLTFNSTGGYVWEKLGQGKSIDEIVDDLASDTGSDPATVDRDVRAFVEELKSNHLFIA
jgi:hypothetical protein